jgi:redox-sensitive bicupin YhaK (pirin superfamily)
MVPLVGASARGAFISSSSPQSSEKMTMRHIPANSLYVSTPKWWLESRFHFNFAEYYNPANSEFGVLRVLNDDLVKPNAGFGTHSHRDMEIFTYVVQGNLTHKDSIGTSETLGRGAVQYMSAGSGIRHSEMNSSDELLRFLQIWINPNTRGLKPNYGSRIFNKEDRHNKIQHVLTDFNKIEGEKDSGQGVIPIHQDCNIYVSEADPGVAQDFVLSKNRQAYLVCIEGKLSVSDLVNLDTRDAVEIRAKISEDMLLQLKADKDVGAHFLLIEMALA